MLGLDRCALDMRATRSERRYGGLMTPLQRPRVNPVTAADICAVSVRTIYRWIAHNQVEYVRTPTGAIRIYTDSLLRTHGQEEERRQEGLHVTA